MSLFYPLLLDSYSLPLLLGRTRIISYSECIPKMKNFNEKLSEKIILHICDFSEIYINKMHLMYIHYDLRKFPANIIDLKMK